jgi:hypothetical protein
MQEHRIVEEAGRNQMQVRSYTALHGAAQRYTTLYNATQRYSTAVQHYTTNQHPSVQVTMEQIAEA